MFTKRFYLRISSGLRIPNWTLLTFFTGALESLVIIDVMSTFYTFALLSQIMNISARKVRCLLSALDAKYTLVSQW